MLWIIRLLSSPTGDSPLFSVVGYLSLAEDDFSVPSNTGLFLKPCLFVGLVSGRAFPVLIPSLGDFLTLKAQDRLADGAPFMVSVLQSCRPY